MPTKKNQNIRLVDFRNKKKITKDDLVKKSQKTTIDGSNKTRVVEYEDDHAFLGLRITFETFDTLKKPRKKK